MQTKSLISTPTPRLKKKTVYEIINISTLPFICSLRRSNLFLIRNWFLCGIWSFYSSFLYEEISSYQNTRKKNLYYPVISLLAVALLDLLLRNEHLIEYYILIEYPHSHHNWLTDYCIPIEYPIASLGVNIAFLLNVPSQFKRQTDYWNIDFIELRCVLLFWGCTTYFNAMAD